MLIRISTTRVKKLLKAAVPKFYHPTKQCLKMPKYKTLRLKNVVGLRIHIIIYRSCISFLPNIHMMCPVVIHFKSVFRKPVPLGKETCVDYCNYSYTTECKIYYFLKLEKNSTIRTTNKYYGSMESTLAVM